MDNKRFRVVGALLDDLKRDRKKSGPSVLDVLRAEFEKMFGRPLDDKTLESLTLGTPEPWPTFVLELLVKFHPQLRDEKQKDWTDFDKYMLVRDVEYLHAVGYGKRRACELLEASGKRAPGTYRRYLKFKKDGGWDDVGDLPHPQNYVTTVLRLPLPKK